jgi:hypothetical protein
LHSSVYSQIHPHIFIGSNYASLFSGSAQSSNERGRRKEAKPGMGGIYLYSQVFRRHRQEDDSPNPALGKCSRPCLKDKLKQKGLTYGSRSRVLA